MKTFLELNRRIQLGDVLCRRNSRGLTMLLVIDHKPSAFSIGMIRYQVIRQDSIPENVGKKRWGEQPLNESVYSPMSELVETKETG